jgi:NADPH-dependent 2,4-dienoyl-CoA reductase/sulfur reductase-like enzyme
MLREIIRYYGIPVMTSTVFRGVENGEKLKVCVEQNGKETKIDADSVIMSVGYVPARGAAEALEAEGYPAERIHVIGDAREVGNLMSVIREAYELCYKL